MTKEQFLKIISKIESDEGRNTNHPMMKSGIHKGHQAIGKYALMPNTIDELIKRRVEYDFLKQMDPKRKAQYLAENPKVEADLANSMYNHLNTRMKGDPAKMAYAYNHGMYLNPDKINQETLKKDDYTNKYNKLAQLIGEKPVSLARNMQKSENNLQNTPKNLPTNSITPNILANNSNLEDIMSDPSNPLNKDALKTLLGSYEL